MLKVKLSEEQGLNVHNLQYNLKGVVLSKEQRDLLIEGKTDEAINTVKIVA